MKKMLITGINGFVGSSAMQFFLDDYEIAGMDISLDLREKDTNKKVVYYQVDMIKDSLEIALEEIRPDVIIHCAGSANVGLSVQNPKGDFDGNLNSLYQLLMALQISKLRPKLIMLSSAAVYGTPEKLPICEEFLKKPISPYGLHKLMCEELCDYYRRIHQFDITVLRVFSAYGNGLRKQILWDLYHKYKETGKMELFGTGDESRDFIHITDVMQCIELILKTDSCENVYNIANGEEITIRDLARQYADVLGITYDHIIFNGSVKEGDPQNWCANIDKIKELGYQQKVLLKEGIKEYVNWLEA